MFWTFTSEVLKVFWAVGFTLWDVFPLLGVPNAPKEVFWCIETGSCGPSVHTGTKAHALDNVRGHALGVV
jgi:hypothetical protein